MDEISLAMVAIAISILTAAGSFVYTHKQTKAAMKANELTEQAQREQVQPFVIADIRERVPGSTVLCFFIENSGPTVARDVRITVDPPLRSTLGDKTAAALNEAVTRRISVLPPGRQLMFLMDGGHQLFASDLPRFYTVTVKSSGPFGPIETLTYTIDLDVMKHSLLNRESLEWSTHVMAEETKKARKAHEKQAAVMSRLLTKVSGEIEARRPGSEEPQGIAPVTE